MATETSRTFDPASGRVISLIKDAIIGNIVSHTIYVTGPTGVTDVNAEVQKLMLEDDANAQQVHNAMTAAGWNGNPAS